MTTAPTHGSPLELSETYTSVKDFLLDVQAVAAARYDVHVGYRKVKRIFDRWRAEDCLRHDQPRMGQDKQMRDDPTGETAIRSLMRELAHG